MHTFTLFMQLSVLMSVYLFVCLSVYPNLFSASPVWTVLVLALSTAVTLRHESIFAPIPATLSHALLDVGTPLKDSLIGSGSEVFYFWREGSKSNHGTPTMVLI